MGVNLLAQLSCKIHAASVNELDARVTSFYFSPLEFAKVRLDRKEFRLDDRMYDIVRIKKTKDCLEVLAFQDGKEEEVLKSLASIFDFDSNKLDNIMHDVLIKVLHLTYIISAPIKFSFFKHCSYRSLNQSVKKLMDRRLAIDTPPPKYFFFI